jgi:hypothetical protein
MSDGQRRQKKKSATKEQQEEMEKERENKMDVPDNTLNLVADE